jgi:hypothetical protein
MRQTQLLNSASAATTGNVRARARGAGSDELIGIPWTILAPIDVTFRPNVVVTSSYRTVTIFKCSRILFSSSPVYVYVYVVQPRKGHKRLAPCTAIPGPFIGQLRDHSGHLDHSRMVRQWPTVPEHWSVLSECQDNINS